ncbi:MAG: alpha/beta hydrolase family protein [Candidatus Hodarchaeota archaeon]
MSLNFRIRGHVCEQETNRPLPNLFVRAYDKDLLFDDLLGDTVTDKSGDFTIFYSQKDFQDLFEKRPDIYFRIYDSTRKRVIHMTADCVHWNVGADEFFKIAIPRRKLPQPKEEIILIDSQGQIQTEFEVGDSLLINAQNLTPNTSHVIRLIDNNGQEIISVSLISNRVGNIEPTVLWPDIGIGDPQKGGLFAYDTYEEALNEVAGLKFTLELSEKDRIIADTSLKIATTMNRTRLYPISSSGNLQRGLLLGRDDIRIKGENFPDGTLIDLYLVERQYDWRSGNKINPIHNIDGSKVSQRVKIPENRTDFVVTLWPADQVRPGSYDIIARTISDYEYLADELTLRSTDLVSERLITTLVVRDDVYRIKPVWLGCVNAIEIAGKKLSGSPYFKFTNNFPKGTDVYAALDPAGLIPEAIGKKVRFYVVSHKTEAQWNADSNLTDVTGTVSEVTTSSGCINANKTLVWSNPQQIGKYDLVVDFGNNNPNPTNFVADSSFDPPLDMIDGYFKIGFHVTEDPAVQGNFPVGATSYDEPAIDIPAVGVWPSGIGDTPSGTLSLPLRAEIRYPAVFNGNDVPVSTVQANYPIIVTMHGMHTTADPSYLGYNYLLDHLASHGFLAVSIDCNPINAMNGMQDTRAHAILEHLSLLQSMNNSSTLLNGLFQGKIDMSNIGVMGHSRGGDGVVQAEIFNQNLGLGFSIKAVVALAPTDFSGTSPNPLVLSTSNFLCIYGSNDGDVAGWDGVTDYTGTGFRFYDRATIEKAMVFIYGATHNRFNTEWGTESAVDESSPAILDFEQHRSLLRGYMTAFLQIHLQNRDEQRDYFRGEIRIPSVDEVEVYTQYRLPPSPMNQLTLDDYESEPAIDKSSLGGQVAHADLLDYIPVEDNPREDNMVILDEHTPHQTRGLKLMWNAMTGTYQSEIPLLGTQRDVSDFTFFSFRVSQKVAPSSNPPDQPQDFYVRLNTADGGNSRSVRVGYFGTIPYPYKPEYDVYESYEISNTKSAMNTIRIPLRAWTIKCLSAPIVDLTNIESITIEFRVKPTGEILIDDIEFTN